MSEALNKRVTHNPGATRAASEGSPGNQKLESWVGKGM